MTEPDAELSALVDSIYETYAPELTLVTNAVDLNDSRWVGYYTGLTDTTGIEAAVASETAINAQAYSLVLVRVAEGTDAAEMADRIAASINPGKWICAQADQVMVGAAGNIAMLVIIDIRIVGPGRGRRLCGSRRRGRFRLGAGDGGRGPGHPHRRRHGRPARGVSLRRKNPAAKPEDTPRSPRRSRSGCIGGIAFCGAAGRGTGGCPAARIRSDRRGSRPPRRGPPRGRRGRTPAARRCPG